ncbi:DUF6090 family protein [Marinoscillum sp.]|uniref:DUF6090 family protein n=1 Tax=Marinoscillum sp. TaxID=2024838 RepID=UPI003BAB5D66
MKKLLITLSQKWPEYLIEGVVIVASILGAIALENWNEHRKERAKEQEYLTELQADLITDLEDITYNLDFTIDKKKSNDKIIEFINNREEITDSIQYHLANLLVPVHFLSNTQAFEAIQKAGIDIIQNDSLRREMVNLYDFYEKHLQYFETNDDHKTQYDLLVPIYLRKVRVHELWQRAEPIDPEGIYSDPEFYNVLTVNRFYRSYMISQYELTGNKIEWLLRMVESEILDQ